VREFTYSADRWWETLKADASPDKRSLSAVLSAVAKEDRDALFRSSDPDEGQDRTRFDQQLAAMFQQFKSLKISGIRKAYGVDGLLIFVLDIETPRRKLTTPFVFKYRQTNELRFLPYQTEKLAYHLVRNWLDAHRNVDAGPSQYLSMPDVARATHEVRSQSEIPDFTKFSLSLRIRLSGSAMPALNDRMKPVATRIEGCVTAMKSALEAQD